MELEPTNESAAIRLVIDERARQASLGYDAANDDALSAGVLADLAAFIAISKTTSASVELSPWARERSRRIVQNHGADRIKMLTIAAALLIAEIEREQRAIAGAAVTTCFPSLDNP